VIFLLHVPDENALIHASGDKEARIGSPSYVEHVFRVAHQAIFGGPAEDAFWSIYGEAVLSFLPDGDALVIGY
jgi:hypothetical protein